MNRCKGDDAQFAIACRTERGLGATIIHKYPHFQFRLKAILSRGELPLSHSASRHA